MLSSVEGRVVRSIGSDTFADLTAASLVVPGGVDPNGLLFDGDLDVDTAVAIHDRMTSRDDADEECRTLLRAALAAGATNLAAMHLAYTLGDPVPDAVLPQE